MRLKSRFILAVNAVIFAATAVFFFVDDYRIRTFYSEAIRQSAEAGIFVRGIAERVHRDIQDLVHGEERLRRVRSDLQGMSHDLSPQGAIEIRLTDSRNPPRVIASMTGESERRAEESGRDETLRISRQEQRQLEEVSRKPEGGFIVNMGRYDGQWGIRLLMPYTYTSRVEAAGPNAPMRLIEEKGLIEMILEAEQIPRTLLNYRLLHLLFVALLAVSLTALISVTTDRIVLQPLNRLTEMIRRAETGEPPQRESFPRNEVGRVSETLSKMLAARARLHAERISALERLSQGVAHEIRNPLHAISLSAQYLKGLIGRSDMSAADAADAQETLELAMRQVEELNRITSQFMDLTRPSSMDLESSDIREELDRALEEFALSFEEAGIQVHRRYGSEIPLMELDIARLRSAFYNLIQNAVQAMPGGGSLYAEVRLAADQVEVEIRDTGMGMSEETAERVFDPYFTTKESEGGVGLGLTLAKQAVEAHRGELEARSRPGSGGRVSDDLSVGGVGGVGGLEERGLEAHRLEERCEER